MSDRGTLEALEPHPAAHSAQIYLAKLAGQGKLLTYQEAFASCALEGNRMGEVCVETITRLCKSRTVSDRYVLGLAWAIRDMEEQDNGSV